MSMMLPSRVKSAHSLFIRFSSDTCGFAAAPHSESWSGVPFPSLLNTCGLIALNCQWESKNGLFSPGPSRLVLPPNQAPPSDPWHIM